MLVLFVPDSKVTWVQDQYWSNLFQLEDSSDVYLLGTASDGPSPIKISRSSDGGASWRGAVLFGEVSGNASYETGPTPVVEAKGRVYRAMERLAPPFTWGLDYQAVSQYTAWPTLTAVMLTEVRVFQVVLHTASSSDLLDPSVWAITPPLPFDSAWLDSLELPQATTPGFLEGNMVTVPQGSEVLRVLIAAALC